MMIVRMHFNSDTRPGRTHKPLSTVILSKFWHFVHGLYMSVYVSVPRSRFITALPVGNSSQLSTTNWILSEDVALTGGRYGFVIARLGAILLSLTTSTVPSIDLFPHARGSPCRHRPQLHWF